VKHGRVGGKEGAGIMYVCMCMYSLIEWAHSNAEYRDVTEMQVAKLPYLNLKREGSTGIYIYPYLRVRNTRFTATAKQKNLWHWSLDGDALLCWMLNRHWLHGSYSFELLSFTHCFAVLWRKEYSGSFVVSVLLSYLV
jgi:hypothetical protein